MSTPDQALAPIKARLDDGVLYRPTPHRAVVNTVGDRWGVVDSGGSVVTLDPPGSAKFYAAAPTDITRLLAAIEAVQKLADGFDEKASDASYSESEAVMEAWLKAAEMLRAALSEALGGGE